MSESLIEQLKQRFVPADCECSPQGQVTLITSPAALIATCLELRDAPELAFEQLSDLCAVDYSQYGKADWDTQGTSQTGFSRAVDKHTVSRNSTQAARFAVVYHLLSLSHNRRLRLKCFIESEPPQIASVIDVWPVADWYEREAFDLFGILFTGHPDLRRLLTDYGFIGHPLRKDFPLEGKVEVRYDPDQERVVYQPVTIENRVLVPRVIRDDNRYQDPEPEDEIQA